MKSNLIKIGFILLAASWIIPSCTKQQDNADENGGLRTIVLSAFVDETKTTVGPVGSGYKTFWSEGDKISINGQLSGAVSSTDAGKTQVDFTVTIGESGPYNVLYPGTSSTNVISIPATHSGNLNAPAYGSANVNSQGKYSVKMKSFCGILRFAFNGSATLDRIELKSLGGQKLSGNFTISNFETGAFSGGSSATVTYDLNSLALTGSDQYVYVALPAQAYSGGMEARVYQKGGSDDGAYMTLKFWSSGLTLARTDIIEFQSKTFAAGRTDELLQINSLTAESGSASLETRIVVGCYNLYAQSSRTKDYMALSNSGVREALGQAVADMGADIIGINEIDNNFKSGGTYSIQSLAEAKGLTGYTWCLAHPDDIDRDGNWLTGYSYSTGYKFADGFAYRTSMFSITDHDWVWISHVADNTYYDDREDAYGNSGGPETTCAYAKFTHTSSGKQFYVFVTHTSTTDHIGSEVGATQTGGKYDKEDAAIVARRLRIVNNVKYFCSQKAGSLPYIVMGDFNFGPYYDTKKARADAAYTAFTGSGYTNAYDDVNSANLLSSFYTSYPGTQTGSNWGASFLTNLIYPQFRIDHIWLKDGSSQNIKAETYRTVRRTYDVTTSEEVLDDEGNGTGVYEDVTRSWCPSDHFPVVATILFE